MTLCYCIACLLRNFHISHLDRGILYLVPQAGPALLFSAKDWLARLVAEASAASAAEASEGLIALSVICSCMHQRTSAHTEGSDVHCLPKRSRRWAGNKSGSRPIFCATSAVGLPQTLGDQRYGDVRPQPRGSIVPRAGSCSTQRPKKTRQVATP